MTDAASGILVAAIEGTTLTDDERRFFAHEQPAGITVFARNFPTPFQGISELLAQYKSLYAPDAPTPLIAIDQEGGRVSRIRQPGFPDLGPAQQLFDGKTDAAAIEGLFNYGLEVGQSLGELGINCDFAPVLDVLSEPTNVAIGDRVFGTDPDKVIKRAGAFLKGLQSSGVVGSLKHFPGQGAAKVDTHKGSAIIDAPEDLIRKRDLAPFVALAPTAPMVMVSHCIYPALDPTKPASLSATWISKILRKEIGYTGVIVSDDMNMDAIAQDKNAWGDAMVESVVAGTDMLLVCRKLDRMEYALAALRKEAARSSTFAKRLEDAAARVHKLRGDLL